MSASSNETGGQGVTAQPSMTRWERALAHRMALALVLRERWGDGPPEGLSGREKMVLRETSRLVGHYEGMDDLALSEHIVAYTTPPAVATDADGNRWCGCNTGRPA